MSAKDNHTMTAKEIEAELLRIDEQNLQNDIRAGDLLCSLWLKNHYRCRSGYLKSSSLDMPVTEADRLADVNNADRWKEPIPDDAPDGTRWTRRAVRELSKLIHDDGSFSRDANKRDVKRVSKIVVARVMEGEKLTGTLVKQVIKKEEQRYSSNSRITERARNRNQKKWDARFAPHSGDQMVKIVSRKIEDQIDAFDALQDGSLADVAGVHAKAVVKKVDELKQLMEDKLAINYQPKPGPDFVEFDPAEVVEMELREQEQGGRYDPRKITEVDQSNSEQ